MKSGERRERVVPRWLAIAHSVVSAVVLATLIVAVVALIVSLCLGADAKYRQVVLFKDKIANTASGR